jgi:hypothetical protein
MLRCTVVVSAICSLSFSAAAGPVAGLAAPGDCAQPSARSETPPLYQQAAGVGGSAAEHFAPRVTTDVLGLLPLDLTRTRTTLNGVTPGPASLVERTVETTATGALGSEGLAGSSLGGATGATESALTGVTGAVDALTGTATRTTSGVLGGLK